ncbi:hypothetical protein [Roseicella sp. DB1501]|uniref:hypothetical protein n=1 Tax=Roseicella sp. DB1501 TaxID=2730925 RepID=UPI001491BB7F|nr:hypothetical protein [Roseicella sp. DB1501]NOG74034.1 hypothetical protein [Roseicella sp. DB1501]
MTDTITHATAEIALSKLDPSPANARRPGAELGVEALAAYVTRPRAQLGFTVIEADGTRHGFQYHALRHPKWHVRNDEEFLGFMADGIAVPMQGHGLAILHTPWCAAFWPSCVLMTGSRPSAPMPRRGSASSR